MDKKPFSINKAGKKIIRSLIGPAIGITYAEISRRIVILFWDFNFDVFPRIILKIIIFIFIFPAAIVGGILERITDITSIKIMIENFDSWGKPRGITFNILVYVLLWAGIGYGIQKTVRLIARKRRAKCELSRK